MGIILHINYSKYFFKCQGRRKMNKAYFYKVDNSTSWLSLMNKTNHSILLGKKPLYYKSVCKILLNENEFDAVCDKIISASSYCSEHYFLSNTDCTGIRNCLELLCNRGTKRIIIYTSGNAVPLYAAVISTQKE